MSNKHKGCEASGIHKRGLSVRVENNNVESAMRVLKKQIMNDGLLKELRAREYFEQPSITRRRKKAEAVLRERRRSRSEEF